MKKNITILGKLLLGALLVTTFSNCKNEKQIALNKLEPIAVISKELTYKPMREPVVFITGVDGKNEGFYGNARSYFENQKYIIVDNIYSIEEIINWLNKHGKNESYGEIHIVNKSNPFQGMELETTIHGEKVTKTSLRNKIEEQKLPKLENVVSKNTKVVFHSDGVGSNKALIADFKKVFSTEASPQIIATKYHSIFDSPFSNHHLAKAYYVFYPTAKSPGKMDLSKEIARKYPSEKEIDWFDALNNEHERYVGEAYTKQYNVPVKFELDYSTSDYEVPILETKEDVINFILQEQQLTTKMEEINIPLDKFRWKASIHNNKLNIKGISTVLCVLKPIIKPYGNLEHQKPSIDNTRLYGTN